MPLPIQPAFGNYLVDGPILFQLILSCMNEQYGKDYEYEAPVKLLDKLLHSMPQSPDEQLVVVSQVYFWINCCIQCHSFCCFS